MAPKKPAFDPYAVLELERDCSEKDIQKAYKKQCLKWHPDKHQKDKDEAQKRFLLAKDAFELLFDKEKRANYDEEKNRAETRARVHGERMAKADSERRRHMENLSRREKEFEEGPRKPSASASSWDRGRHEARVRAEIEEMRKRLEKEAQEEYEAQQKRLKQRLAEFKAQEERDARGELNDEVILIEPGEMDEKREPPQLKVRWKEEDAFASTYDDAHIRAIFEKYGSIHVLSSITPGKKGRRMCIVEFVEPKLEEDFERMCVAEKEQGDVEAVKMEASWLKEPQKPRQRKPKSSAPKPAPPTGQGAPKDVTQMSFEELQAQLFGGPVPDPSEQLNKHPHPHHEDLSTSKKWYEEEE